MQHRSAFPLALLCMTVVLLSASATASAHPPNPCRNARVHARAEGGYLLLTYRVQLHSHADGEASVALLGPLDVLEGIDGLDGRIVVSRAPSGLRAVVPCGWRGELAIRGRVRTAQKAGGGRTAVLPLPPAVSTTVEVAFNEPDIALSAESAVVEPLEAAQDVSRFRVVPAGAPGLRLSWARRPPPRPGRYSVHEEHDLHQRGADYSDRVTLTFEFGEAGADSAWVSLPAQATVTDVQLAQPGQWRIENGRLTVQLPRRAPGSVRLTCRLEGQSHEQKEGWLLPLPLFGMGGAQRRSGTVRVTGARHELTFCELSDALQTPPDSARLACTFRGRDPRVALRILPVDPRWRAEVASLYNVSRFSTRGRHRLALTPSAERPSDARLTLPAGHFVRLLRGPVRTWSQQGRELHLTLADDAPSEIALELTTEHLTGGPGRLALSPPVPWPADTVHYEMAIAHSADVQLQAAGTDEGGRVRPDALCDWLRKAETAMAYARRDAEPAAQIDVLELTPEIRGSVQDHVTVGDKRLRRDTLFLLEVTRRPLERVTLLMPEDLAVESVEGPSIETWIAAAEGGATVQFRRPVTGSAHFRVVSAAQVPQGPIALAGIGIAEAPHLRGWLGIGADVSVHVRPVEDGRLNLASLRTDRAPDYLQGFENRLLYEFFDSDWRLDLLTQEVPPRFTAQVLHAVQFRAAGIAVTAVADIQLTQGGLSELRLRLPPAAVAPELEAPNVVSVRWDGREGLVTFRGRQSGDLRCSVRYALRAEDDGRATVEPVRFVGAEQQSGLALLLQGRADVDVVPGRIPAELTAVEAAQNYPRWSWRRTEPAVGAWSYRGVDWSLPVETSAAMLSGQMLQAAVPVAKVETLVQDNGETLNHLRLFVVNTTQQFLSLDLAALHPETRLIGTYVYGEPLKPFREGPTKLRLPLFTSEKASQVGMSVIDVTFAVPQPGLGALRRETMSTPELGVNVGRMEWTLRVPPEYHIAAVAGNMHKAAAPPQPQSLGGRAAAAGWAFLREHTAAVIALGVLAAVVAIARSLWAHPKLRRQVVPRWVSWVLLSVVILMMAAMLMPALEKTRRQAAVTAERSNLHEIGLGIQAYRIDHAGAYPASLNVLVQEGYLSNRNVLTSPQAEDLHVVYDPPPADAPAQTAVAYFLGPSIEDGTSVLFADGAVTWAPIDEQRRLINPRTGELIARLPPPGTERLATKRTFATTEVATDELAGALAAGQQMARQGEAAPAAADALSLQVDRALVAANQKRLEKARTRYRKEHAGREPASAEEMAPYVEDSRLREALRALKSIEPSRVRLAAEVPAESHNLHNVGVGISMYRQQSDGEYPSNLQELVELGYIEDASVLRSLQGPDVRLVYRRPPADADGDTVVAYFYSPHRESQTLLFADGSVRHAETQDGRLVTPSTSEVIRESDVAVAKTPERAAQTLARRRYNLGLQFMRDGDYPEAEEQLLSAIQHDEDYQQARRQLQRVRALRRATGKEAAEQKGVSVDRDLAELRALQEQFEQRAAAGDWQVAHVGGPEVGPPPQQSEPPPDMPPRRVRASLVHQLEGGRSLGAMPIEIDFPAPQTVLYRFEKPYLGRGHANLSFRVVPAGAVVLAELVLAAAALLAFGLLHRRSRQRAATFAAAGLLLSLAVVYGAPPLPSALPAAAALVLAACLAGEAVQSAAHYLKRQTTDA